MTPARELPAYDMLALNRDCACFPIARPDVEQSIYSLTNNGHMAELLSARANYFAATPVFLGRPTLDAMIKQIAEIEGVIQTPDFQNTIFDRSALAAFAPAKKTRGVFMGYDFHITENGPRLIEINSNAGGAFIVNAIGKAIGKNHAAVEKAIVDMFVEEWRLAGRSGTPKTLAIMDENLEEQFHYPDMILAASLFEKFGFKVIVTDPEAFDYRKTGLFLGDIKIDLIYNRLTDFNLAAPHLADLKQAWLDEAVIVTPDPRHHASHADKRNLATLSEIIPDIPETVLVTPENRDWLWENRKAYYFKPFAGFGSRAVYRGAKLTRSKWTHICEGGYIAQQQIKPPLRLVHDPGAELKFDVRVYTYGGKPIVMAARVYQGQVTNLRTQGGGLAPIIEIDGPLSACYR